jgi:hypothetical protein
MTDSRLLATAARAETGAARTDLVRACCPAGGVEDRRDWVRVWEEFGGDVPSVFVTRPTALTCGFFATVDMALSAV